MNGVAAGENVYCSVAMLRPGMKGEVRFSDDHHTANPIIRGECVKGVLQYSRTGRPAGGEEGSSQEVEVAQALPITILKFQDQVFP